MECRSNCGACCIAPSINTPYFGMPNGKPANTVCCHLNLKSRQCAIWGTDHYPETCKNFKAEKSICGDNLDQALTIIADLENQTHPSST